MTGDGCVFFLGWAIDQCLGSTLDEVQYDQSLGSRTYALVIYNLNDGCQSAGEWAVGEEHNAAHFDEPPLRGLDLDFCHLGGGSGGSNR